MLRWKSKLFLQSCHSARLPQVTYWGKKMHRIVSASAAAVLLVLSGAASAQVTSLPSETPPDFTPNTQSFDFVRRTAMIPMRDGIKLYTVIYIPKAAHRAPMLL